MQRLLSGYGGESARFFLASQKRRRDFDDDIDKYHYGRKSIWKREVEGNFFLASSMSAARLLM